MEDIKAVEGNPVNALAEKCAPTIDDIRKEIRSMYEITSGQSSVVGLIEEKKDVMAGVTSKKYSTKVLRDEENVMAREMKRSR